MNSWPVFDRVPLRAPGYVKMPGRPKTERRREAIEGRKATKMPKNGTVIRCSKCHMPGHSRSTCEKRSRAGTSQAGGSSKPAGNTHAAVNSEGVGNSQPAGSHSGTGCIPHGPGNPNAIVVLSNTQ